WGVDTSLSGGTYNAATGTWSITLAPGQNFTGGPRFVPPANSDVDLTGLTVTATSTGVHGGATAAVSVNANIYVDAVCDAPLLGVGVNSPASENTPIALFITTSVADTDGSEAIAYVRIAGVPNGFSFIRAGNAAVGTNIGNGVWQFSKEQLAGLKL